MRGQAGVHGSSESGCGLSEAGFSKESRSNWEYTEIRKMQVTIWNFQ